MAKRQMSGAYSCRCTVGPRPRKKSKKKAGKKRKRKSKTMPSCAHPKKYKKCVATQLRAFASKREARSKCRKAHC